MDEDPRACQFCAKAQALHQIYQQLIDQLPEHIYWKDKKGVFLGCNLAQAKAAGFSSPGELIGKTDDDMPWRAQIDYRRKMNQAVMHSGVANITEALIELPDGCKKIYCLQTLPLYDAFERIIGVLGIAFDRTDHEKLASELQVAKQQVEEAHQTKTQWLKNLRHDVRTPLTGILGFAKIIGQETQNAKIKDYTDNLMAAAQALLALFNTLVEVVKISAGEVPVLRCKFACQQSIEQVIDLLRPKALAKRIDLIFHYAEEIPTYVIGDPERLTRILLELLSNALNFTDYGFVRVSVEIVSRQSKDFTLSITVQDTGVGIPEEEVNKIQLRFNKLTSAKLVGGDGFGLSIVKQFIDELKGELYCQSERHRGSTFTCLIPFSEALLQMDSDATSIEHFLDSAKRTTEDYSLSLEASQSFSVLVVEDEPLAARVTQVVLNEMGCTADIAPEARTALALVKQNDYDLIFMDLELPALSGYDITKVIRADEWGSGQHIPIIALTGHANASNKQKCIAYGMDAVLAKPLHKTTAKAVLNAFARRKTTAEEVMIQTEQESLFNTVDHNVMDLSAVMKIVGSSRIEEVKAYLKLCFDALADEMELFKKARKEKDWKALEMLSRQSSEGATYFGALSLKQACIRLEEYLAVGQTADRDKHYARVIHEMERLAQEWIKIKNC